MAKIRNRLDSATDAHHVSFLYENQEGGVLCFYFIKIHLAFSENLKLNNNLNYLRT